MNFRLERNLSYLLNQTHRNSICSNELTSSFFKFRKIVPDINVNTDEKQISIFGRNIVIVSFPVAGFLHCYVTTLQVPCSC